MPYINPNHRGPAYGDGYMQGGRPTRSGGEDHRRRSARREHRSDHQVLRHSDQGLQERRDARHLLHGRRVRYRRFQGHRQSERRSEGFGHRRPHLRCSIR